MCSEHACAFRFDFEIHAFIFSHRKWHAEHTLVVSERTHKRCSHTHTHKQSVHSIFSGSSMAESSLIHYYFTFDHFPLFCRCILIFFFSTRWSPPPVAASVVCSMPRWLPFDTQWMRAAYTQFHVSLIYYFLLLCIVYVPLNFSLINRVPMGFGACSLFHVCVCVRTIRRNRQPMFNSMTDFRDEISSLTRWCTHTPLARCLWQRQNGRSGAVLLARM